MVNWLSISQNSGSGDATVTITASTNQELNERITSLVVSTSTLSETVDVTQLARPAVVVSVYPDAVNIPHTTGETNLFVVSNGSWTASTPNWLSLNVTSGTGNAGVIVTATSNTGATDRVGNINFRTIDMTATTVFTQSCYITVSASTGELNFANTASTKQITVYSNGAWHIESCPSWVTPNTTGATGNSTVSFSVQDNPDFEPKSGFIVLKSANEEYTIIVTQEKKYRTINVSPLSLEFSHTGGTAVITAETNSYWVIVSYPQWLSLSTIRGTTGETLINVTCRPDDVYEDVTGAILFQNEDTMIEVEVTRHTYYGITAVYNFETVPQTTHIINSVSGVKRIVIDGVDMDPLYCYYSFPNPGRHVIEYEFTSGVLGSYFSEYDSTVRSPREITLSPAIKGLYHTFEQCSVLSAVTIPSVSKLEIIGADAFSGCTDLTSFTIPSGVTGIGPGAFTYSGLRSIVVPDTVTEAYYEGSGVRSGNVFLGCSNLVSAYVSSNIKYTKEWFAACGSLTGVTYYGESEDTMNMFYEDWSLVNVDMPNIKVLGTGMFEECTALTSFSFADSGSKLTSSSIPQRCFYHTNIQSLDLSASTITSIGKYAFTHCHSLTDIKLPFSLNTIDIYAFNDCTSLTGITCLAETTPEIKFDTIQHTSYGDNNWNEYQYPFKFTPSGGTLSVLDGVDYSSWMGIDTPSGQTGNTGKLQDWNTDTAVVDDLFVINNHRKWLYCETGSSQTVSVFAPSDDYTVSIEGNNFTFSGTPSSGLCTFNVESNTINTGDESIINNLVFTYNGRQRKCELEILGKGKGFYVKNTHVFNSAGTYKINNLTGVTKMVIDDVFYEPTSSITVDNPSTLDVFYVFETSAIPNECFYQTNGLKETTLYDPLRSIGSGAYSVCFGLSAITINEQLTSISGSAFNQCSSLTSVVITCEQPNGFSFYGQSTFKNCTSLTSLTFEHPEAWGYGAYLKEMFYNCTSLTFVTPPGGNNHVSVGDMAFWNCTSLTAITIPEGVRTLGTDIIRYSGIKKITCLPMTAPTPANSSKNTYLPFYNGDIQSNGRLYIHNGAQHYYWRPSELQYKAWYGLLGSPAYWYTYSIEDD